MNSIREWQKAAYFNNVQHGFHEGVNALNVDRKILLAVGELVEAQNELRDGHSATEIYCNPGTPKPEGFGIELADAVIRIMDIAESVGVDLQSCIEQKHEYNVTRPFRHGKAF